MSYWTNEYWTIEWANDDEIFITGPNEQHCYMDGGDFTSILSGLCAGHNKEEDGE